MRTAVRRASRWSGDAGVNQAAEVGTLVLVTLAIIASLVTLGPRIGGAVAHRLICELQADGAQCSPTTTGPAVAATPIGAPPGGPGIPDAVANLPVRDCAGAQTQLAALFPGGTWDSTALDALGAGVSTGLPPQPGNTFSSGTWSLDGCSLAVTADRDPTGLSNSWTSVWHTVVAGLVGAASAAVAYVGCGAAAASFFPPIEPFCGAIAGFTIGFVWNLVGPALDGQPIGGPGVLKAFLAGLIAAVPAGFAQALDGIAAAVPGVLRQIATAVSNGLGRSWGWIQRAAGGAVTELTTWLRAAADYVAGAGEPAVATS